MASSTIAAVGDLVAVVPGYSYTGAAQTSVGNAPTYMVRAGLYLVSRVASSKYDLVDVHSDSGAATYVGVPQSAINQVFHLS